MPSFKTLKKTLNQELTDLELLLLLHWKPMNAPKGMNLWGLYLGTGRNYPVNIFGSTNVRSCSGKPSLLETQEQLYNQPELLRASYTHPNLPDRPQLERQPNSQPR